MAASRKQTRKTPEPTAAKASWPKGMSKPAIRALASIGVHSVEGCAKHSLNHLRELHGMGPKALAVIAAELKRRKLRFHA